MPSPRSRGRENPSRSRVGCCCLSPALGACLPALVCASTHPPLAQSTAEDAPSPSAAGSEQAPPPGLPRGVWAFLQLPEAAGAPVSLESGGAGCLRWLQSPPMPLPRSFFPSLRLRLSIPPKLCHHRCMLHICVEALSPWSKGPSVPLTLPASQTHPSTSGWVLQGVPGMLVVLRQGWFVCF